MSAKYKSLIVFTTCELSSFNAYCKDAFSKENTLFNEHDFMPLSCRNIALIKEALQPQVSNYTSHGAAAQTSFFHKNQSDKLDFCKFCC